MSFINVLFSSLCAVFLCVFLKQYKPDFSPFAQTLVSTFLLSCAIALSMPILDYIRELSSRFAFEDYLSVILKSCSVGLLTQLAVGCAEDAGEKGIASKIELCGKCALLLLALPLFKAIIEKACALLDT